MWWSISKPLKVTGSGEGKITSASSPFGSALSWDFTAAANKSTGYEVRVKRFDVRFLRRASQAAVSPPPSARSACEAGARKIRAGARRRAALRRCAQRYPTAAEKAVNACEKRARKLTQKRRRNAAIRKCRARPRHAHLAVASASATNELSPFACTGCASGRWSFKLDVHYYQNQAAAESVGAQVPCAGSSPGPSSGGGLPCIPPVPCLGTMVDMRPWHPPLAMTQGPGQ